VEQQGRKKDKEEVEEIVEDMEDSVEIRGLKLISIGGPNSK
jgi:hypothetical protein